MKFQDPPKITGIGRYTIDVPFSAVPETIEKYLESYGLQMNPDFQRGHVWTDYQKSRFLGYVLMGGVVQPIYFNHQGWMRDFKGDFVCVDGLQRLTAILEFFQNKVPAIFPNDLAIYVDEIEGHFSSIDIRFNVNDLKTRKEVLQWYIDLNSGGTVHTIEEIEKVKKLLADSE